MLFYHLLYLDFNCIVNFYILVATCLIITVSRQNLRITNSICLVMHVPGISYILNRQLSSYRLQMTTYILMTLQKRQRDIDFSRPLLFSVSVSSFLDRGVFFFFFFAIPHLNGDIIDCMLIV